MARRHLLFAEARVATLLLADVTVFVLLRLLAREAVAGTLGARLASAMAELARAGPGQRWSLPAALLVSLSIAGTYGRGEERKDPWRLLLASSLAAALTLWGGLWQVGFVPVLVRFVATVAVLWLGLLVGRLLVDLAVEQLVPTRYRTERMLFVGDPHEPDERAVAERLARNKRAVSLGWLHDGETPIPGCSLGPVADVWDAIHRVSPDTVVLSRSLSAAHYATVVEAASAAGCRVLSVSRDVAGGTVRPHMVWQEGLPFVELAVPALRARQQFLKRCIDVTVAGGGLLLLWPVGMLIAAAIKLDSPGPVFFRQERVGLGGRVFRLLKFRTMQDGADRMKAKVAYLNHTGDERLFKIPNDPRVTRIGAFLRRWSLDELPQLWNVLTGRMSLVGPRPFFESDLAAYADHHFSRLGAKPGMTGLWQISGRSAVLDFEEVVRLDREYIAGWSIWLDFRILLRTLPVVIQRNGAY